MLRDNLAGLIEPMLSSTGAYPLALATDRKELSDDRPQYALKIPARQGGIYALTENAASPFHAEPCMTTSALSILFWGCLSEKKAHDSDRVTSPESRAP